MVQSLHHPCGLCWTLFSMSMSFTYWEDQNWTKYSKCSLACAEQRGTQPTCLLVTFFLMQPCISLLCHVQIWFHQSFQVLVCQAVPPFPEVVPRMSWWWMGLLLSSVGLCTYPCWILWVFWQDISPACWGPPTALVYQQLLPVLCHQPPLAEGTLCPIIQINNEGVDWDWIPGMHC